MKRVLLSIVSSLVLAATLAACGSNVKLDDVPVEDRTASAKQAGDAAGAASRGVTPVQIGAT
ncbi:MAG: peptidoglycan-associated lipoprotein, partial [Polaromonas sp.]